MPPEIISANVPLLEILDDRLAGLLPVGERPLPLPRPRLVLRLDHHHAALRRPELSHYS